MSSAGRAAGPGSPKGQGALAEKTSATPFPLSDFDPDGVSSGISPTRAVAIPDRRDSPSSSVDVDDKPEEACGVFGIFDPSHRLEVARVTYFGLYALQHRGQESAGIATGERQQRYALPADGAGRAGVHRGGPRRPPRPHRHRPHALLDHRLVADLERPAVPDEQPGRRDRPRAQRQPRQLREAARGTRRARASSSRRRPTPRSSPTCRWRRGGRS